MNSTFPVVTARARSAPSLGVRGFPAVRYVALRAIGTLLAGLLAAVLATALAGVEAGLVFSWIRPPVTALMIERLFVERYRPLPIDFIPIAKIPLRTRWMFVRVEDATFYRHPGIDLDAIRHAMAVNRELGAPVLGGSTITQQLVRTLFLTQNKNYGRKLVEAIMAVSLNSVMSKDRQLELYLNYIEWGKGVYGIGAASRYYYRKPFDELDLDSRIRLAVIISSPLRYSVFDFGRNPGMVQRYDLLWSTQ